MAEQQMPATGSFCWNELATSDSEACQKFYTELLGWTSHEMKVGETNYTVFKSGDKQIGGMMQMTAEFGGLPSHWMSSSPLTTLIGRWRASNRLAARPVCHRPTFLRLEDSR